MYHREANVRAYPLVGIFEGMLRSFAILPCFRRAAHRPYGAAAKWIGLEVVDFSKPVPPDTIVINTPERKLYFVLDGETAIRYPIAVPKRGAENGLGARQ